MSYTPMSVDTFQPSLSTMNADVTHPLDSPVNQRSKKKRNGNGGPSKSTEEEEEIGNNSRSPPMSTKAARKLEKRAQQERQQQQRRSSPKKNNTQAQSAASNNNKSSSSTKDRIPNDLIEKKGRMRTVEDVINRIKHDPIIRSHPTYLQHFIIAYIDRVFGDQEVGFEEFFTNEDLKEIPLHRISYLRYCDALIWCRSTQYDGVFGSTPNSHGVTLETWLEKTEELVEQQAERWAWILADEKEQEKADANMLRKLDQSILEQREMIRAIQGEFETKSHATSGFDFGEEEDRQNDFDEDEDEDGDGDEDATGEVDGDYEMVDVSPTHVPTVEATPATPALAPSPTAQTTTTPTTTVDTATTTAGSDPSPVAHTLDSIESLPARAPRAGRASARQAAAASKTIAPASSPITVAAPAAAPAHAATSLEANPSSTPATASSNSSSIPNSSSSSPSSSLPFCDASTTFTFTVNLYDPSLNRIRHSVNIRASLGRWDWNFLKKRIASRFNLKGGVKEVKRMYITTTTTTAPSSNSDSTNSCEPIRLTEDNYLSLIVEGSKIILMSEEDLFNDPLKVLERPKANGLDEIRRDREDVEKAIRSNQPPMKGKGSKNQQQQQDEKKKNNKNDKRNKEKKKQNVEVNQPASSSIPSSSTSTVTNSGDVSGATSTATAPTHSSSSSSRPNYFISLRITVPTIIAALNRIQTGLIEHDSRYGMFCVPQGTYHITLSLLTIRDEIELTKAMEVFTSLEGRIRKIMRNGSGGEDDGDVDVHMTTERVDDAAAASGDDVVPSFPIRGLSSFNDRVLYADLPQSIVRRRLNRVATLLAYEFDQVGVGSNQNYKQSNNTKETPSKWRKQAKGATMTVETAAAASSTNAPSSSSSSSATNESNAVDSFTPHLTIAKMRRPQSHHGHWGGGKHGKKKYKSKLKIQRPNTGIIELADETLDPTLTGGGEHAHASADSDMLPPLSRTTNAFASLARDDSTLSNESTISTVSIESKNMMIDTPAEADRYREPSASSSSASYLAPSTSVIRRIDIASYQQWIETDFGQQTVTTLDLCAMQAPKQPDGYYQVKAEIRV